MRKILNKIIAIMLVIVSLCAFVACDNDDSTITSKGLLIKKDNHGDYVISKYTEEALDGGVLDIGKILDENKIDGEVRIKAGAFDGNSNITKLIVSDKVTQIDKGAFRNMKALVTLEVPFIGKTANADAFFNQTGSAADKSVDSERTLAHFFSDAQYDEGKVIVVAGTSVYMPFTFKEVVVNANKGHDVIPVGGTQAIESYSIPYLAFSGATNLKSITLKGDKLFEIGESAFAGCTGLKEIEIPATVNKIYKNAFNGCTNLTKVTIKGTDVVVEESAFKGCTSMDKFNAATEKTVNLTCFKSVGKNAFDFGRKVTFTVVKGTITDVEKAFGETKFN